MPTTEYGVDEFFQNAGTSPKMVYDVAGVLGWSPHNLLLQSQAFDDASWSKTNTTITANAAVAPNGLMEADKIIETAAGGVKLAVQGISAATGIQSVYAKAAERSHIMLYTNSSSKGDGFNLATGEVFVPSGFTPTGGAVIQSVGNGWYRCSIPVAGEVNVAIYMHDGTTHAYTGDGTSGLYLWGAQINRGTVPTAYLPTTTAARFGLALDHDPVTHAAKGLLVEPQATNVVVQSQTFDNAIWSVFGGVAKVGAAPIPAPDGTMTAYEISFGSSGGPSASALYQGSPAGTVVSFFVRAKTGTTTVRLFNDTNASSDLTVTDTAWTRLVFVGSGSQPSLRNNVAGNSGNVYVWGAQLEAGSVATSHIPTLAATVTRAADQVSVTPASINYSATAGSWWADINEKVYLSGERIIAYASGVVPIYSLVDGYAFYDAPSNLAVTVSNVVGNNKIAVAFASADRAITANGAAPTTNAVAGIASGSPGSVIYLGCEGSFTMNGYIRQLRYLPRRPTNAELQAMTT